MDINSNESVNLGGNVITSGYAQSDLSKQVVQPVSVTSTTGESQTITINKEAEPIGTTQVMTSQVIAPEVMKATVNEEKQEAPSLVVTESIVRDEFIVPTVILKDLVAGARKVGTYNPINVQSQVIDIELNDKGIKVNTSNGKIDYECVNSDIRFTKTFKTCVDIKLLGDLLSNLDFSEIELVYSEENGVLTIKTPAGGQFHIAPRVDASTNQVITLDLTFPIDYNNMISVDYSRIVDAISQSKPVRDFPKVKEELKGTYFTNLVLASDETTIFMQENQDILKTQQFFISGELCDLITSLDFNSNKFRMGFTTDGNNGIRALTISDGALTICGAVEPESDIPAEVCNNFWSTNFASKVKVDTKKFINALKRITLFMDFTRNDCPTFEFKGSNMRIIPDNDNGKDGVLIENPTNFEGTMSLPLVKLQKILATVKSENFIMSFDNSNEINSNCICLEFDNHKWIVTKAN